MAPHIVTGWNPLAGDFPSKDDQVFELLTAAVFQARFRPDVVRKRWPNIREGFMHFELEVVASWPDEKLAELMEFEGMIRNTKKIRATLLNARELKTYSCQYGNLQAHLCSFGKDQEALVRDIDTWAHYIGAPSIRWFVQASSARSEDRNSCCE